MSQLAQHAFARGRAEEQAGRLDAAMAQYRAATRADPNHSESRIATARLLARRGERGEAEIALRALLKREPDHVAALRDLGWLLGGQQRYAESLACYDRLQQLGIDVARELSMVTLGFLHVCDWSERAALLERIEARIRDPNPLVMDPYALFALTDDPALHARLAERMAAAIAAHAAPMPRPAARKVGEGRRLRIGYLCGDFNQHATSLLMAGVIEAHDPSRFEIIAYDYSTEDGSAIRDRIVAAFERFERLGTETPAESAARIARDEIDILIDMKGYTERTRTEILALRPAPIQVNCLGYVGTQGAPWVDYVIADETVLPADALAVWHEQPVWLPDSYYPGDRTRPAPAAAGTRAEHGLPETGFVFGCFNNPFKLSPDCFAIWMELLRALPGSVLWLYAGNPFMAANLRREAASAGVDPGRLVFAEPLPLDRHIARHACLDLFLDSWPYGAHTTAADSLWAGVPVLTLPGRSFPSRVGASLLRAAGLPELIADSPDSYAALALALARDPKRLQSVRERLAAARDTAPLFDAPRFCRHLEAAFEIMAERSRAGLALEPIRVARADPA